MKKITPERLYHSALFYLERYEASSDKLRAVLKRRVAKAKKEQQIPDNVSDWIEAVILKVKNLGYLDDERYAQNVVRRFQEAGKSRSFIYAKLKLSGIDDNIIQNALFDTDELVQARIMVQKRHLGNDFNKDLARLARAGFSYEIARQVLEELK